MVEVTQPAAHRGDSLEVSIPPGADAPRRARRIVASWLGDDPRRDAAILATSEIVTNAVRHGDLAGQPLGLRGRHVDGAVQVAVHQDTEVDHPPRAQFPPPTEEEGRGLAVVTRITDTWGFSLESGLTVWFELTPLPLDAGAAAGRSGAPSRE